jgi:hypothetical protein
MKETKTIGIKVLPFPVTAVEREPSHELTRRLGPPSAPLSHVWDSPPTALHSCPSAWPSKR